MDWQTVASVCAVGASIFFGAVTLIRGSKADTALSTATMVQSVYVAQQSMIVSQQERINMLQSEVQRIQKLLTACEERDKLRELQMGEHENRIRHMEQEVDPGGN